MTARLRGLVLSDDAGRIVVEPTGGEVARFGRGQAVEVSAVGGPLAGPVQNFVPWTPGFDYTTGILGGETSAPSAFPHATSGYTVRLRTLCGCERLAMLASPLPRYHVPLYQGWALGQEPVYGRTRTFVLQGQGTDGRLLYAEEA